MRSHGSEASTPAGADLPAAQTLADVVDRLRGVFEPRLPTRVVVNVVRRCRRELEIVHAPVPPDMVERLALERLADVLSRLGLRGRTTAPPAPQTSTPAHREPSLRSDPTP